MKSFKRTATFFETVTAAMLDASGYAEISNSGTLGAFTGATVAGIATQTDWELDITIDGTLRQLANIDIDITDDWDTVAAAIETSLQAATSSTETVAIVDGKFKVTSATTGATSTVLIASGTAGTGSGDLLAAITALSADYTSTLDTPVDGTEGTINIPIVTSILPTDDFRYVVDVKTSAGLNKAGLIYSYNKTTGILTIQDNGSTTELADGDEITVIGTFFN